MKDRKVLLIVSLTIALFLCSCSVKTSNDQNLMNRISALEDRIEYLESKLGNENNEVDDFFTAEITSIEVGDTVTLLINLIGGKSSMPSDYLYEFYLGLDYKQLWLAYPEEFTIKDENNIEIKIMVPNVGSNNVIAKITDLTTSKVAVVQTLKENDS